MMSISLIVAGILMLSTLAIHSDKTAVNSTLSIIGTLSCAVAFDTGYLFTKELFPTVLRTTAVAFASASGRFGTILSPLIAGLDVLDPTLPILIYGVIVMLAGIQSIVIWPETNKMKLPDSVEEAEKAAQESNCWIPCSKEKKSTEEQSEA